MRTRLLAAVAVFAAALLAPSAAFAAPVLDTPAPGTLTTNAPIDFTWHDGAPEDLFRVVSGDIVTGSCPPSPAGTVNNVSGDIVPPFGALAFQYTPTLNVSACFYVEAQDAALTITDSAPVLVTYDKPLGVSVTAPTDPSTVHGAGVTVSASVTDPGGSGVTQVDFLASGPGGQISLGTDTTGTLGTYSVGWNTTLLNAPDGLYTVWAVGIDGENLQTTSTVIANIRVDNTPPAVAVTAPTNPSVVHGASVTVSANASDGGVGVTGVDFFATGSGAPILIGSDSTGSPYSVPWDTTTGSFPDGVYTITAVATDGVNPPTTSAPIANVRVDNTPPAVSVVAPVTSAIVRGSSVTVSANASDGGAGVVGVDFYAQLGVNAPILIGSDSTGSPYGVVWNTTVGVADGIYSVWAVASDGVNAPTTSLVITGVRVDNAPPTGAIGSPVAPANLRATLSVDATASDGGSGVDKVDFQSSPAGANTWTTFATDNANNAPAYHGPLDTTALVGGDGLYDLRIIITDLAGNPAFSQTVAGVRVDNTRPTVPGTPTGFATVQAAPAITFAASTDPPVGGSASGVDHYNVLRNGSPAGVVLAPATSFTDTDSSLANGLYTYTVVAVDKAGNPSLTASGGFQIFLDSGALSAPTSVTALATPTNQRPQVSWVAPVSAPFLHHYNVYRDSNPTPVGSAGAGSTTFTDLSGTLTQGIHSYQVVAADVTDLTLGVASGAVTILYDVTAPAAPAGVTANAGLDGSIGISWLAASDSGSGVGRYVVRRSLSSTPPVSAADGDATCQGTATSCTDATALNGKLYSYAVFAVDNAGNTSLAGVTPPVTAHDQLAPVAPKGLSATPADASVALKWAAAGPEDDVAGYVLVAKQGSRGPVNETDGTRVCAAIVATSTNCTATGLTNGATYTFGLFALDEALNRSLPAVVTSAPNGKVTDVKAPAAVSKLDAHVSGHKVTLTWKNPADHDFDHVEITAAARRPAALKASKRVYSGRGTKATTTLAAGQSRWFVVVAYDGVGNASQPVSVHVAIKAASKFGPAPRAKVHGKVRLSWPVRKGAKYYNVQVYAGKKRILVSWPAGRALQLPRAKLKRGTTYTWYVWPGLGAKAKAHYGKLIGKNAFTFTG